ncbi:MAG: acetylxylan esterase, partial [Spirochaetia bacterium]|nr:acetylxylan esterase [Spirochaetia bacterium]
SSLVLFSSLAWSQEIVFITDHTNALYKVGEKATFTLKVLASNKSPITEGKLNVRLDNFGPGLITNLSFDLSKGEPITVSGSLSEPGFLKCSASIKLEKDLRAVYGAGYEPEKIRPGSPRPSDFDSFWDNAVKKLDAEVPADIRLERIDAKSDDKHESFRVSAATFDGLRVWGFLVIPKQGEGPFPVEVSVPGAGPGVDGPNTGAGDRGSVYLAMNVHPFEPGPDKAAQQKKYEDQDKAVQEKFGAKRYAHAGATNRETYFYYPIILGINRMVNYLATRPEVDKTRFYYSGTSQGGGFGYILCGLNPNFTKGVMHVAAMCDFLGFQAGRDSGWPKLIENLPEADKKPAILVAPYFDGAHFAPRIKCPVRLSVGFSDETCPPAAVYAAYNSLTVKDKGILHGLGMPHSVFPRFYDQNENQWMRGVAPK